MIDTLEKPPVQAAGDRDETAPAASLTGAVKRYGEVTALDGVDLAVRPGEVVALLGPNGAGKTTAVKLLLGLARPDAGRAELFGGDPRDRASRRRLGTMLQISGLPETLSPREHLELFGSYYPRPVGVPEALDAAGLGHLAERPFGKLSGGERQRLLFALARVGDPELLVLDEPTVGLDVEARRALWREIRRFVGRRIRCIARVPLERVEELPQVTAARWNGPALEVFASRAEPVVRTLLALDPRLEELEVTSASLEEAFLALTADGGEAAAEHPSNPPEGDRR